MQDAIVGGWAQESHLSVANLGIAARTQSSILGFGRGSGRQLAGAGAEAACRRAWPRSWRLCRRRSGRRRRDVPTPCSTCASKTTDTGDPRLQDPRAWRVADEAVIDEETCGLRAPGAVLCLACGRRCGPRGATAVGHEWRHRRRLPPHHRQPPACAGGDARLPTCLRDGASCAAYWSALAAAAVAGRSGGAAPGSAVRAAAARAGRAAADGRRLGTAGALGRPTLALRAGPCEV